MISFPALDLPANKQSWLNTSCPGICVGSLLPGLRDNFPDASVKVVVTSRAAPRLTLTPGHATLAASATLDVKAVYPGQPESHVLGLEANFNLTLKASISNDKLVGEVIDSSFNLGALSSHMPTPFL